LPEKTLIEHGVVYTVNPNFEVIEDGAVAFEGDRITFVGKASEVPSKSQFDERLDAQGKIVMPGMINCHTHSASMRGLSEGFGGLDYLTKRIRPYRVNLKPDDVYAEALLTYAEALKTGTTALVDMHQFMHRCGEAAEKLGVRAMLTPYVSDMLPHLSKLDENEELFRNWNDRADGRVKVWFGVDGIWDCTPEYYVKARELADKYHTRINTHAHMSMKEPETSRAQFGKTTIELLYDIGFLRGDVLLAHTVWLSNKDMSIVKSTGASIAHCPTAAMRSGNGVSPVPALLKMGVNVALGTDSLVSGGSVDMFEQLKIGALLHRVTLYDPLVMPSDQMIRMATMNGAIAVGLQSELGSLEVGKKADVVIASLDDPAIRPVMLTPGWRNLETLVVMSMKGKNVETVFVDGKCVVRSGLLAGGKDEDIIRGAEERVTDMLKRILTSHAA
jgi:5-methylthioadenosine/S-adenosylhomocysteine deaminase